MKVKTTLSPPHKKYAQPIICKYSAKKCVSHMVLHFKCIDTKANGSWRCRGGISNMQDAGMSWEKSGVAGEGQRKFSGQSCVHATSSTIPDYSNKPISHTGKYNSRKSLYKIISHCNTCTIQIIIGCKVDRSEQTETKSKMPHKAQSLL